MPAVAGQDTSVTPPPCTNCCCCCAIIDWCCCCVWVCSVTLFLCRMNDRICSSRGEMKSELADSPPPTPTPPCGVRLEEAFSSLSCVACCHYIVQVGMRTFYNYIDKRTHGVFAPPPQNRKRIVVVGLQQKCAKIIFEVSPKRSRDCPI